MTRLVEYFAVTAMALCIVMFVIYPAVEHVARSIENSANMIAEASHGQ